MRKQIDHLKKTVADQKSSWTPLNNNEESSPAECTTSPSMENISATELLYLYPDNEY
jgi:hypothetical protein